MPLSNCKNKSGNCIPVSSTCISFEGPFNDIVTKNLLPCAPNLDDIITLFSGEIKDIKTDIEILGEDVSQHSSDIEDIKLQIETIDGKLLDIKASDIKVTIDLKCLTSSASDCLIGPQTYPLDSILQLLVNKVC